TITRNRMISLLYWHVEREAPKSTSCAVVSPGRGKAAVHPGERAFRGRGLAARHRCTERFRESISEDICTAHRVGHARKRGTRAPGPVECRARIAQHTIAKVRGLPPHAHLALDGDGEHQHDHRD